MDKFQIDSYVNLNSVVIFNPGYYTTELAAGSTLQFENLFRDEDILSFHVEGRGGYSAIPLDRLSGVSPLDPQPPHIGQAIDAFQRTWRDNDSDPFRQKIGYLGLSEIVLQYQPSKYFKFYAGEKFWEKQLPLQGWAGHPASRFGVDYMGQSPLGGGVEVDFPILIPNFKEGILEFSANCRDLKHCSIFSHASINGAVSTIDWSARAYVGWGNQAWPTDPNPASPIEGNFVQGGIIFQLNYKKYFDVSYAYAQLTGKNPEIDDTTTRKAHVLYLSSAVLEKIGIGLYSYFVKSESQSSVPERDPYQRRSNIFILSALSFSTGILKEKIPFIPNLNLQIAYQFSRDLELLENEGVGSRYTPNLRPLAYPEHMAMFSASWNGDVSCLFKKDKKEGKKCVSNY